MSTIVTRAGKGSALTWTEGDANFTNLNNDKLQNIVEDTTPQLGGNLDVQANSITTSVTNGDIVIEPNGTGDVHLVTDALRVGDLNTEARISTYGTGNLVLTTNEGNDPDPTITIGNGANADITLTPSGTGIVSVVSDLEVGYGTGTAAITSAGAYNLDLVTQGGTNSGLIRIVAGANGNIELTPNGTGDVVLSADTVQIGDNNANATLTTNGTGDLILNTNNGSNSGAITIADAANGNISITPNGTGKSVVSAINYNEGAIFSVTYASTITPNVTNGNVQTVTLTGNVTFSAFASPVAGQSLTLKVVQDATGSRLLTSTMKFAGASKTLSTAANSIDIISVYYDGTNYFASLAKGFA